jgi:hypothetical protein
VNKGKKKGQGEYLPSQKLLLEMALSAHTGSFMMCSQSEDTSSNFGVGPAW